VDEPFPRNGKKELQPIKGGDETMDVNEEEMEQKEA
jgi:hypothetical protein